VPFDKHLPELQSQPLSPPHRPLPHRGVPPHSRVLLHSSPAGRLSRGAVTTLELTVPKQAGIWEAQPTESEVYSV